MIKFSVLLNNNGGNMNMLNIFESLVTGLNPWGNH